MLKKSRFYITFKALLLRLNFYNTLKKITATSILILTLCKYTLGQGLVANFTASPLAGCSPLVVNFQDLSSGNPTAWAWNFGNGATSTLKNPGTTYFTPGTYTITLTVTNAAGSNTLTRSQYITVYENPSVDFSTSATSGCFPWRVQFTDMSSPGSGNNNVAWFWDLGNGTQSTQPSPLITYTTAGNFTITYKVTNDKGCTKVLSKPNLIHVIPGAISSFTNSFPSVCAAPANITFTNTSNGPGTLDYLWDFGDGNTSTQQDPVHNYASAGIYNVTLITNSSSGCIDTLKKINAITIGGINTTFNYPPNVCFNDPIIFQNTSLPKPISSRWNFGDGTTSNAVNPIKIYSTPGSYTIKVINTYSYCQDSASKTIQVFDRPVSNYTAPITTRCQPPLTVNFQDASTNAVSWQWNFGDGTTSTQQNPVHIYNSYGNFNVTLITTNSSGCSDSLVRPAFIKIARPVISFANLPANGCVPYSISPVSNIVALDAITSYLWNFGDGTTSTLASPSHTYPNQGVYNIKLVISSSTGCTDSVEVGGAILVGTKPNINFTGIPTTVCAYQPVQFTDQTVPADTWLWHFGDGSSSALQNPKHIYSDTGFLDVTLIATNYGCKDSITKVNYIHVMPPIADFVYTPDCNNRLRFTFTDLSVGATTWSWNFGDGTTSVSKGPIQHSFPSYGTFFVTLTVTNGTCTHSKTDTIITVKEAPNFHASQTAICKPGFIYFYADNIVPDNIVNYFWDFGIGQQNTPASTGYFTFNTAGTYSVRLVTSDLNGCTDTVFKSNYIRVNGPIADFNATNKSGCVGLNTLFTDISTTDGVNPIVSWKWDFGDGNVQTFTSAPFVHIYNKEDTFSVKLIVTDSSGCMDSIFKPDVVITSDPVPDFYSADTLTCPGGFVTFVNTSSGRISNYFWDLGDGTTNTDYNSYHTYTSSGVYTIKLIVTDSSGCTDSLVRNQYIKVKKPVASFTVNDSASSCTPFEVNFTNTSQYIYSSYWDLGGGTSTLKDPTFYYTLPGVYNVELIGTSPGGCTDTSRKKIQVFDTSGSRISYLPLDGCKPLDMDISAFTNGIYTYLWDYGDGAIDSTAAPNMTHTYTTWGSFIPKLILKDPGGCLIPITGPDTVIIRGANTKFGVDKKLLCDSGFVNFIDSTTFNENITGYSWSFGDGTTSNVQEPTHFYSTTGFYDVYLAVETLSGCRDTARIKAPIKIVESPLIGIGGDTTVCIFSPMMHTGFFQRPDTSAVSWSWLFPNGNTSTTQNPANQIYSASGFFNVQSIATNSSGCKDTAIKRIQVYPLPTVDMPGAMTIQVGFPRTIPATYSPNTATWVWTPSPGLSCTSCPEPMAGPKFNTSYNVSFVDSNGCQNSSTINIIVFCKNSNIYIPNTFSPNGDGNNDIFYPRGRGIERIKLFRIFNRWGEIVYERRDFPINDPLVGWDGKFKGQKSPPDVFVYQIEVFCDNGETLRFDGNVALIL